jgi:hypothetical protein
MRVRVNFTIEIDVDQYREKIGAGVINTKQEIRAAIQGQCEEYILLSLADEGVNARSLGINNAYDPTSRQTMHEDLVASAHNTHD